MSLICEQNFLTVHKENKFLNVENFCSQNVKTFIQKYKLVLKF